MAGDLSIFAQSYYGSSEAPVGLIIFLIILAVLYFLPSIIGFARKKSNSGAIFVLNLLLGWMFVGWVISLVWALTKDQKPMVMVMKQPTTYTIYPVNYQPPMITPGQNQAYGAGQNYYPQSQAPGGFSQVPPAQSGFNQQPTNQQPYYGNSQNNPWGN